MKAKKPLRRRQCMAAAAAGLLVLAGCGDGGRQSLLPGAGGGGFVGAVAADEPQAVTVARDLLAGGASAADAAVALYFTLAVTYPSGASLGGGGVCLAHHGPSGETLALDFLPGRPTALAVGGERPSAVPGNVRGMTALHARFGTVLWQELVIPAEMLARHGVRLSRALASDLAVAGPALLGDGAARALFGNEAGALLTEGDLLRQNDLADMLGEIRVRGGGDFYSGRAAQRLVEAVAGTGGAISLADLRDYAAAWRDTARIDFARHTLHAPPPPAQGGLIAMTMWAMLDDRNRYLQADPEERPHLLAEASKRAYALAAGELASGGADRARLRSLMADYDPHGRTPADMLTPPPVELIENPSGASFVVADRAGTAIACSLTMNNLFGNGRVAPGTGIVLAAAPQPGQAPVGIAPLLLVGDGEVYMAGAASGGIFAPSALIGSTFAAIYERRPLVEALAQPRIHHGGKPDAVVHEAGRSEDDLAALSRRGHRLIPVPQIGRVNLLFCPDGLRGGGCRFGSDRRGFGIGAGATF